MARPHAQYAPSYDGICLICIEYQLWRKKKLTEHRTHSPCVNVCEYHRHRCCSSSRPHSLHRCVYLINSLSQLCALLVASAQRFCFVVPPRRQTRKWHTTLFSISIHLVKHSAGATRRTHPTHSVIQFVVWPSILIFFLLIYQRCRSDLWHGVACCVLVTYIMILDVWLDVTDSVSIDRMKWKDKGSPTTTTMARTREYRRCWVTIDWHWFICFVPHNQSVVCSRWIVQIHVQHTRNTNSNHHLKPKIFEVTRDSGGIHHIHLHSLWIQAPNRSSSSNRLFR